MLRACTNSRKPIARSTRRPRPRASTSTRSSTIRGRLRTMPALARIETRIETAVTELRHDMNEDHAKLLKQVDAKQMTEARGDAGASRRPTRPVQPEDRRDPRRHAEAGLRQYGDSDRSPAPGDDHFGHRHHPRGGGRICFRAPRLQWHHATGAAVARRHPRGRGGPLRQDHHGLDPGRDRRTRRRLQSHDRAAASQRAHP